MQYSEILEYANRRFSKGPIGIWSDPTSSPFSQFGIEFRDGGNGTIEYSAMDSPTEGPYVAKHQFTWRTLASHRIEIDCVINENERDHRIVDYQFQIQAGTYGLELVFFEPELPQIPNTLFYFNPPRLTWHVDGTDAKLEEMLETDPCG